MTSQTDRIEVHSEPAGRLRLVLPSVIDSDNVSALVAEVRRRLGPASFREITVDLSGARAFNDFGVLCLMEIRREADRRRAPCRLLNVPGPAEELLSIVGFASLNDEACTIPAKTEPPFFERVGDSTLTVARDILGMVVFIGEVLLCLGGLVLHPRGLRRKELLAYMYQIGVNALPIVFLINFLLGLILAFMSSFQLRQFGADIYVASLVSLAMVKELGPIMTSIIVAGRSGSAFAAEIGSMQVSEEVDALRTMGMDTIRFLVMPKLVAAVIVVPFLVLFANLFGIAGGLIVGVGMLDLSIQGYIQQTVHSLRLFDFVLGFLKGGLFALIIAWIGCFRGFQTRGGASDVGRSTTSAVVSGIFLIILADSLLAVIMQYWGL